MNISRRILYIAFYVLVLALMVLKDGIESYNILKIVFSSGSIFVFVMLFKISQQINGRIKKNTSGVS